jgi:hypothetical protein
MKHFEQEPEDMFWCMYCGGNTDTYYDNEHIERCIYCHNAVYGEPYTLVKALVQKSIVTIDYTTYYLDWDGSWYFINYDGIYHITNKWFTLGDWLQWLKDNKRGLWKLK